MSDETKTAVTSGEQATAAPVAVEPEVTSETIADLRTSRNREGLRKIIEKADKPEVETKDTPAEVKPEVKPQPQAAPVEPKKFKDKFRGKEFEIEDDDGFLGYKNLENLKKENAHKRLYLAEVEEGARVTRELVAQKDRELSDHKRLLKEAQDKLTQPKPVAAPAVAEVKVEKVELPKAPKKPATKLDPLNEESQAEWQKYFDDGDVYNQKVEAYLQNFKPEIKSEIPPELQAKFDSQAVKLAEYDQYFATAKTQKEQSEKDAALNSMWNARAEFQTSHKDFATKRPLKDIDRELIVWSDRLASLNGLQQPMKPYNLQDPDWYNYEKGRTDLIAKYASGDVKTVESAGTFTPPEEYKSYMAVIELENKRKQMVDEGVLGQKATLHDAFVKDFDASGKMAETLSAVEKENILRGAKSVTEALKNVGDEFATTLPPEVGGKGKDAITDITKIDPAERDRILALSAKELFANPELRRKKQLIMESIT